MDWNWLLFSFEGRINRAKIWLAAFIWFATVFSFMTIWLWVIAGILRATGHDLHFVSTSTMHPAFYLLGFPLLVVGIWLFAATAIKRLHDRGKSGWWVAPFFIASGLLSKLSDWLDESDPGVSGRRARFRFKPLVLCRTVLPERHERTQPVWSGPAGAAGNAVGNRADLGPASRTGICSAQRWPIAGRAC